MLGTYDIVAMTTIRNSRTSLGTMEIKVVLFATFLPFAGGKKLDVRSRYLASGPACASRFMYL